MMKMKYTKAQIKKAEKVGIPVEDLYPADRWGVLEWLEDIEYEAGEIAKKYGKEGRK